MVVVFIVVMVVAAAAAVVVEVVVVVEEVVIVVTVLAKVVLAVVATTAKAVLPEHFCFCNCPLLTRSQSERCLPEQLSEQPNFRSYRQQRRKLREARCE